VQLDVEQVSLPSKPEATPQPITVPKTVEIQNKLNQYLQGGGKELYPTSLTKYIQCPLYFYLEDIAKVKEEQLASDEMDYSTFGNILHDSMQGLYQPFRDKNQAVSSERLEAVKALASSMVRKVLKEGYGFTKDSQVEELSFITATEKVIVQIVKRLIDRDIQRAPFTILKLEEGPQSPYAFPISVNNKEERVMLNGKFDRVDRRPNSLVEVVDYKTGGSIVTDISTWEDLFSHTGDKQPKEAFQIITYAWLLQKSEKDAEVRPTILKIGDLFGKPKEDAELFSVGKQPIESVSDFDAQIKAGLSGILEEIFDVSVPFTQTSNLNACKYCSFVGLCQKA
jgi:hypothetical protein